jgi:large subunit ribosomal protein L22
MAVRAKLSNARISARKARLVADLIRGADLDEALRICQFTPKKAAEMFLKLLKSAQNNADQASYDVDNLYVQQAFVDDGFIMHRYRPMAMGRAGRIRKRSSHLTVVLEDRSTR